MTVASGPRGIAGVRGLSIPSNSMEVLGAGELTTVSESMWGILYLKDWPIGSGLRCQVACPNFLQSPPPMQSETQLPWHRQPSSPGLSSWFLLWHVFRFQNFLGTRVFLKSPGKWVVSSNGKLPALHNFSWHSSHQKVFTGLLQRFEKKGSKIQLRSRKKGKQKVGGILMSVFRQLVQVKQQPSISVWPGC